MWFFEIKRSQKQDVTEKNDNNIKKKYFKQVLWQKTQFNHNFFRVSVVLHLIKVNKCQSRDSVWEFTGKC